jgi:Protein of unknown function (DUF3631)
MSHPPWQNFGRMNANTLEDSRSEIVGGKNGNDGNYGKEDEPNSPPPRPPSLGSSGEASIGGYGAKLLDELTEIFSRYVVLPKWAAEALALWTVHTYAFELREVSTYIGLESPEKRCGKTTLLGLLSKVVNRPVVAANISPSAFFRVIEKVRPTLLIDEADTFLQGNDELRGILNAGYARETAYVIRVRNAECGVRNDGESSKLQISNSSPESFRGSETSNSKFQHPTSREEPGSKFQGVERTDKVAARMSLLRSSPTRQVQDNVEEESHESGWEGFQRYSCWCPKVMAAIGRLPDTLADRCIVIRMQRKRWDEECGRLRDLDTADLRQRCARFVREHAEVIREARPVVPGELHDRAADIWEPLFIVADLAGGEWPEKARRAAITLTAITQENNPISSFLFDLFFVFVVNEAQRMFTIELLAWLNSARFSERPWMEARKGKPVTDVWVAQQLRPYGVRPKAFRVEGKLGKGYLQEEIMEVCRRYVPQSEVQRWKEENPKEEVAKEG